jgi:amino acid transporter
MLSPESLVVLGNNVGFAGISFLAVVLAAVVLHLLSALSYGELFSLFPGPGGEARFIRSALGPVPAIALPLCSRVVFAISAATGILVTAGYVFNEVFVYWFPNLGFSFCLLGLLLVINLLGQRVSVAAQVTFVAVAILGLIALSAVGLIGLGNVPETPKGANQPSLDSIVVVLLGLVLLIGYDLAGSLRNSGQAPAADLAAAMVAAIVLVGAVFCLWGFVSMSYVPSERLSDTTVPYSLVARAIMGQKGRVLMGVVLLAGACSAVNVLLFAVSRMMAAMANHGLLPSFLGWARERAPVPLIILVLCTAAMMAYGMGGEPELEVYTKAGLLFWLLNYGAVHVSVLIMRRRTAHRADLFRVPGYPVATAIALSAMVAGFVGLAWSDSASAHLLRFMAGTFAIVFIFGLVWTALNRRKNRFYATGLAES